MEKEVNFIRVQNEFYVGMYYASGRISPISEMYNFSRHPMLQDDSLLLQKKDFNYGFSSLKQMRSWIYEDEWIKGLYEMGYIIYSYIIPAELVLCGNTQAVVCCKWFAANKEKFVKKFKLEEIS